MLVLNGRAKVPISRAFGSSNPCVLQKIILTHITRLIFCFLLIVVEEQVRYQEKRHLKKYQLVKRFQFLYNVFSLFFSEMSRKFP